jgi:hypothetical protein
MAERMRKSHQEDVRKKIQVSQIFNRLQDHLDGKVELTSTQVQSAKILLDKSVSNAPTEVSGPNGGPVTVEIVKFAGQAS